MWHQQASRAIRVPTNFDNQAPAPYDHETYQELVLCRSSENGVDAILARLECDQLGPATPVETKTTRLGARPKIGGAGKKSPNKNNTTRRRKSINDLDDIIISSSSGGPNYL